MDETEAIIHQAIEQWRESDDLSPLDPLRVQLRAAPEYLPLLQPKPWFSHYGRRTQDRRVLGLSVREEWVQDGSGSGRVGWVYGTAADCFGQAPFAMSPLARARMRHPQLADLIWSRDTIAELTSRYVQSWRKFVEDAGTRPEVDPVWVLRRGYAGLALALGRLESAQAISVLLDSLGCHSPAVRARAIGGLSATTPGHIRDVESQLIELSVDENVEVRTALSGALARHGTHRSLQVLVGYLNDVPVVQEAAIDGLVILGLPQARYGLLRLATTQTDLELAAQGSAAVRTHAILALQTFWQDSDEILLLDLLRSDDSAVRAASAHVLGEMHVDLAKPALRSLMRDEDPGVRMATAYALVSLRDDAVIPPLTYLATNGCELYDDPITGQEESEITIARLAILRLAEYGSSAAEEVVQELNIRPS